MLSPGDRIDRYRIQSLLKKGGMAVVYLAEHELLRKKVALKLLPPEMSERPEMVERFLREARAAATLDHPHIINIHDVGESNGVYYIGMDLVEGGTVLDLIRRFGKLPENDIVRISQQVLSALQEAHRRHLIHRDLKPQNIMINAHGDAVVMDFGIAKAPQDHDLTKTGMFIGTLRYTSPEQASGEPADARSDLFSWGVVMYEMATGQVPYTNPNTTEVLFQILNDPPPPPITKRPDLSPHLSDLIVKALAKRPEDRFASAQDMLTAIQTSTPPTITTDLDATRTWLDDRQTTIRTLTEVDTVNAGSQTRFRPRWRHAMITAAAALILIATGAWWFQHGSLSQSPVSVKVWTDKKEYRMGERMRINVLAEDDCYLFLYHRSVDGDLQRIFPVDIADNNFIVGRLTYTIPDPSHPFEFITQPPAGTEKIMGLVTTQPDQAGQWRAMESEIGAAKQSRLIELATIQVKD